MVFEWPLNRKLWLDPLLDRSLIMLISFNIYSRVCKPSVVLPVWLLTLRSKPVIGRIPSKTVMPKPRRKRWSLSSSPMNLCAKKISWLAEMAIALNEGCFATTKKTAMTAQMKMLAVIIFHHFWLRRFELGSPFFYFMDNPWINYRYTHGVSMDL